MRQMLRNLFTMNLNKGKFMIKEIKMKIAMGIEFSMFVDELTTIRGRRCFGLNPHEDLGGKIYKTGLISILVK